MTEKERWTNQAVRAHLGEHGFLAEGPAVEAETGYYTTFIRGEDELTLLEFKDGSEPTMFQNGAQVYVNDIGYRNEQIQHQPLKGD